MRFLLQRGEIGPRFVEQLQDGSPRLLVEPFFEKLPEALDIHQNDGSIFHGPLAPTAGDAVHRVSQARARTVATA